MNVCIIGPNGFLGAHLIEHFEKREHKVLTLSYRPEQHDEFVIDFSNMLMDHQPLLVINAGASQNGKDDPDSVEELIRSNVLFPATVASIIHHILPTTIFINFGTSWQLGENGNLEPLNAYAASKTAIQPFFDHFALSGLRIATLLLYDTYGPKDPRNKVVNLIADALVNRSELSMTAGDQIIDLIYIDDVISAIEATVNVLKSNTKGTHCVYSVRSGEPIKILDLIKLMKKVAGVKNTDFIKLGIKDYRPRERFSLYKDTQPPPNWLPSYSLTQGLKLTLEDRKNRQSERKL